MRLVVVREAQLNGKLCSRLSEAAEQTCYLWQGRTAAQRVSAHCMAFRKPRNTQFWQAQSKQQKACAAGEHSTPWTLRDTSQWRTASVS